VYQVAIFKTELITPYSKWGSDFACFQRADMSMIWVFPDSGEFD
jgi:hypothetical protein